MNIWIFILTMMVFWNLLQKNNFSGELLYKNMYHTQFIKLKLEKHLDNVTNTYEIIFVNNDIRDFYNRTVDQLLGKEIFTINDQNNIPQNILLRVQIIFMVTVFMINL